MASAVSILSKTMNAAGAASSLGEDANGICDLSGFKAPNTTLTASQSDALSEYQNGAGINIPLRDGRPLTDLYQKQVDALDSAMVNNKLAAETKTYRGMHPFFTRELQDGMEFVDLGFVSVTTDTAIAKGFGATVIEIRVPAGTPALDVTKLLGSRNRYNQKEVLLNRGLRFKVQKVDDTFILEVIR